MDFNGAIDIIIKDLRDAQEIIDDLKRYTDVPAFQIELAKAKCKSAAEVIAFLKGIKTDGAPGNRGVNRPSGQADAGTASAAGEELQTGATPHGHDVGKPAGNNGVAAESPAGIHNDSQVTGGTSVRVEDDITGMGEAGRAPVKKSLESAIIADKYSHLSSCFNEQLGSSRTGDDMAEYLKSKPLINLSDAIGINDKFLFIREIFNGNKESYSRAIAQLDHTGSLPEARKLIMGYKGDEEENEAVKQLLDIIKRKFPGHE